MDWSIKSIFRLTHEEELFLLTQNRAKGMLILSLEGCQFQGAQAEFTFNFPPYLSQTAAHFLYHPQPLWWPQSYRTLWKVQDWQQSSPISKQDNWELNKVPSNCTNWCPVWGGKLSEQYRELFSELERSFQPAYYRYAVYFHGGFNPIKNISKEKNTDWQILLSLRTCCSSRFIFRPGNPFPVTDPEGWN